MATRSITDVSVEGVQKRKLGQEKGKQNVYAVKVTWSDGTVNVIYRTYKNFSKFEEKLLESFNDKKTKKSRTIPRLEGKDRIRSDEHKKWEWIDNFCMAMLDLPAAISECETVEEFFTPTPEDLMSNKRRKEEEKKTKEKKKKEKKKRKKYSTIKVIGSPFRGKQYQVLEDYKSHSSMEISLEEGTIVSVVTQREDGWWLVHTGEENGWAPGSYLAPVDTEGGEQDLKEAAPGEGEMYQSLKAYKAKEEDELSFPVGVTLQIVKKSFDGWWTAIYMGRKGYVPAIHLEKLGEKKKLPRFTIRKLTLKSRKLSSTKSRIAREKEKNRQESIREKKVSTTKKQRENRKVFFKDELKVPSRSKKSIKMKRSGIRDLNDNAMVSTVNKDESVTNAEMQEKGEVSGNETANGKQTSIPQETPLRPLNRSQSFSGLVNFVPHITITPPKLKRSLSLDSAVSQLAYKQNSKTEDGRMSLSDSNNGPSEILQNSSEDDVSKSLGNSCSSLSGRARKMGVVSNPMTTMLMRSSKASDITLLEDPDRSQKDAQKQHQITGEELNVGQTRSLHRGVKKLKSNLLTTRDNRISISTPDIRQMDTIKVTDWQPQHFDELHPDFKNKALKIAKKSIQAMIAQNPVERQNAKGSRTLSRGAGTHKSNLLMARDKRISSSTPDIRIIDSNNKTDWHPQEFDNLHPDFQRKAFKMERKAFVASPAKALHSDMPHSVSETDVSKRLGNNYIEQTRSHTMSLERKNVKTETKVNSSYNNLNFDSLRSRNYRARSTSPVQRLNTFQLAASPSPCSSKSGSLSEIEFYSDDNSEDHVPCCREHERFTFEPSPSAARAWGTCILPPTRSLPECPEIYQAIGDYEADNNQELSFLVGELLQITKRAENGWWFAMNGSENGWVPSNFLQKVTRILPTEP